MINETLTTIAQVSILAYVVAGMTSMGLILTVEGIVRPLRDARMVLGVLVANFVVVPAVAVLATRVLAMDDATAAAVILLGCTAGAPFLPTLVKLARGDGALAVGIMVLLMVLTVGFAPLVIPLALEGATVSAGDIASSLVMFMLVPIAVGLVVRARYPVLADRAAAPAGTASTSALVIGISAAILVTWRDIMTSIGSLIFLGTIILVVTALATGYLVGLHRPMTDRVVLALGTAQRNISAALVVATSLGSEVVIRTLVAALALPTILILLAGEYGRRNPTPQE